MATTSDTDTAMALNPTSAGDSRSSKCVPSTMVSVLTA